MGRDVDFDGSRVHGHARSERDLDRRDAAAQVPRPLQFPAATRELRSARTCRSGPAYELGGTFDAGPISLLGGTNLSVLDPVGELREPISAGTAHDEGKTQLDGRAVERIRLDPACPDPTCPREPAYAYVDPDTFVPVEMHGFLIIGPPGGPVVWVRLVMRIVTFEYLARTAANLALTHTRRAGAGAARDGVAEVIIAGSG
jgi:hypothetical protein